MELKQQIEQYTDWAVNFRREMHRHPELSGKEFDTTKKIRAELEQMGIEIPDSGLETGLIAEIHGAQPGKTIAVRADIDALPVKEATGEPFTSENEGVCHACGHDLHTACLLLAARVLNENKAQFKGTVRLMFQPAEESGAGAKAMLAHGANENPKPDLYLAIHTWPDTPAGKVGVKSGPSHASSDTVIIKVKGKGGHGAHPYRCVDPIAASAFLITQLQTIISRELPMNEGGVFTIGSIHGGTAPNVIPGEVELKGTLRALNPEWRAKMLDSIRRICENSCAALRAEAEVTILEGMPPLVNVPWVIDGIRAAADKALGEGHVHELPAASPGSDDFAFYLEQAPGALFRMGTGNDDPATHVGLHAAGNRFDEKGIPTAAAVLTQYLMDTLQ